ncbi:MAG TPA: phytoene/squalene synthase family protein [Candidatus Acidoferrales bacterium]|nr:phytoene/squalene synthase family protein [Candidatus Acidoferrales bacterium]
MAAQKPKAPRLPVGMPDNVAVSASYDHCRKIARAAARNFYYGFMLLPAAKRDALCALYAFMRGVDDISDEPGTIEDKCRRLSERRAEMDKGLAGGSQDDPVWPALRHAVSAYAIPQLYLHDLISGAEMDLTISSYQTFDALREYCYRVAGTVGLCCLYVFGFSDPHAPELAEKLGIAFQLTNILRDLPRDHAMGRVYLPNEDFARFQCDPQQLGDANASAAIAPLVQFESDRAWQFYREGWPLLGLVSEDSHAALWAMARIYSGILEKIERRNFAVLAPPPPRLSTPEKVWILIRARMGWLGERDALRNSDHRRRRSGGTVGGHSSR